MKNIIFIFLMVAMCSCKKYNYYCYDAQTDNLGNITATNQGKVKKNFATESDMVTYQSENQKACIEDK